MDIDILRSLIEDTEQSMADAKLELDAHMAGVEEYRQIISDLKDELHGLRLAAARHQVSMDAPAADEAEGAKLFSINAGVEIPASKAVNLDAMNRTDAVFYVMTVEDRPLDRQGIQTRMHTLGRVGDTLDQISLSLTNLKRSGRAVRSADSRWRAAITSSSGTSSGAH